MWKIKAFLDTNVLMDILQDGRPNTLYSRVIFEAIWSGKIEAVLTTQSLLDAAYIAQKAGIKKRFFDTVNLCCDRININQIDSFDIRFACRNYTGDFEDDSLYYKAVDTFCDFFVTADKDFRNRYQNNENDLQFVSPKGFVGILMKENPVIPS